MTALSPELDDALAGPAPTVFGAVLMQLPTADVALLDGDGELTFGERTYLGRDPTYGVLASVDTISDGFGDSAPVLDLTLLPADDAAAADLASPTLQGSPVSIFVGAVNPATGQTIGTHLIMLGQIDVPTLTAGTSGRELKIRAVSAFEQFFTDDEGIRLSPDWHRGVWPGEAGLDDVTGVTETIYWGVDGVNGRGVTYSAGATR